MTAREGGDDPRGMRTVVRVSQRFRPTAVSAVTILSADKG